MRHPTDYEKFQQLVDDEISRGAAPAIATSQTVRELIAAEVEDNEVRRCGRPACPICGCDIYKCAACGAVTCHVPCETCCETCTKAKG